MNINLHGIYKNSAFLFSQEYDRFNFNEVVHLSKALFFFLPISDFVMQILHIIDEILFLSIFSAPQ